MAASFERNKHLSDAQIWVGKYRNLHNLPHWHLAHELIACRGGNAEVMLEGRTITVCDRFAVFVPSGSIHHINADGHATLLVAQVDTALVRFLGEGQQLRDPAFPDRYGIYEGIGEILSELTAQRPYYCQRANAVMTRMLIDIFREEESVPVPVTAGSAISQYRALLSAIEEESEFLTFSEAAARMNMSEAYFSRYFKHFTGVPFSEYLNLVKVSKAIGILEAEPGISTSDLALRCGFNTLRSFNRVFRKVTGYSPKTLPKGFSLHIRQYAVSQAPFDPTLEGSIVL